MALMRARPPQALDTPVAPIRFSTPCPFLIPPLLSDPTINPGFHHPREGITPPTVHNPLGAPSQRSHPTGHLAPLRLAYLVTPMIFPPIRHQQILTLP